MPAPRTTHADSRLPKVRDEAPRLFRPPRLRRPPVAENPPTGGTPFWRTWVLQAGELILPSVPAVRCSLEVFLVKANTAQPAGSPAGSVTTYRWAALIDIAPGKTTQAARLAREVGLAQVSASHDVSPLVKFVGRGDTTLVDAYLSPLLRRYVERVAAALAAHPSRRALTGTPTG